MYIGACGLVTVHFGYPMRFGRAGSACPQIILLIIILNNNKHDNNNENDNDNANNIITTIIIIKIANV